MYMTKTIFSNLLHKYATRLHPHEQRILPDGYRGRFKFAIDKCILCRLCAIKCPTQVITIDPEKGLWHREVMGCLYCGVCEDVCPTGCIRMTNVYRPPITEPAFLTFHVPPRPKKGKAAASADDIENALEAKAAKTAEGPVISHQMTVEDSSILPVDHDVTSRVAEEPEAAPAAAPAEPAAPKKAVPPPKKKR